MLDIGLGFFLEVTLDEAKPLIEKRKKFYEGKLDKLIEEIAKVRVNITRVYLIYLFIYFTNLCLV
jgi:prefoldin subunit 5